MGYAVIAPAGTGVTDFAFIAAVNIARIAMKIATSLLVEIWK